MGCWNATCALTNLPITCVDPVKALVIRKTKTNTSDVFYPFDLYQPVSSMFDGEYDDYGGVTLSEDNAEVLLEELSSLAGRRLAKTKNDSSGDFRLNDQEYRLPNGWHLVFILKDAFDALLSINRKEWGPPQTLLDWKKEATDKFYRNLEKSWKNACFYHDTIMHDFSILGFLGSFEMDYPPIYSTLTENIYKALPRPVPYQYEDLQYTREEEDKLKEGIPPMPPLSSEALEAFNKRIDLEMLMLMMVPLRMTLTPKSGLGSQSWSIESYKNYGNFILNFVKKREDDIS